MKGEEKMNEVGKIMWSRGRTEQGIVTKVSSRHCACCGHNKCYIVRWPDGHITKPCAAAVKVVGNDLEIE
jgi:hypothetical protein